MLGLILAEAKSIFEIGGCYNDGVTAARSNQAKRILFGILSFFVLLHTGLILAYYLSHALWGNQIWIVDALDYVLPWLFLPSLIMLPLAIITRSRYLTIAAAIPPLLFVLTYGRFFLPKNSPDPISSSFTVMTYNVLDLNERYDEVADQVEAHEPDILGFHELESGMARVLVERLGTHYPYREIEPGRGFFSRYPIESYKAYQLAGDGHWAQEGVVNIEGQSVTFLNAHPRSPRVLFDGPLGLPSDLARDKRDRDFDDLIARIEDHDGALIVMGDINLSDRQDQYSVLRESLDDAHREAGWGLGFTRTHFLKAELPTWRIDYIFFSPGLEAYSAEVGEFAGSDHRPVIARLGFTENE